MISRKWSNLEQLKKNLQKFFYGKKVLKLIKNFRIILFLIVLRLKESYQVLL